MARFLVLNFEDFGLTQDITKSIQSQTLFCVCCLDKNVPLIDLTNCSHSSFLDGFQKPHDKLLKYVICHHCHGILKKITEFTKQVEKSFSLLSSETFTSSEAICMRTQTLDIKKAVNIDLDNPPSLQNNQSQSQENTETDSNTQITNQKQLHKKKQAENRKLVAKVKRECSKISFDLKKVPDVITSPTQRPRDSLAEVKIEFEPNAGELLITQPEPMDQNPLIPEIMLEENLTDATTEPIRIQTINTVTLSKDELMRERVTAAQSKQYLKCPYRCENCIIGFHYEENVIDHMIRRHGPKVGSITCEICLQVLYPPGSLNAHNFRHYTRYDCTSCGLRYPTFDDAMAHYRRMHRNKDTAFKCRFCRFTTSNYSNLKVHKILQHHRYSCKYCGVMMSSATNLTKHLGTVHKKLTLRPEPEIAWCERCDLTFKTKHALELHTTKSLAHVQKDDKYTCSMCGRRFAGVTHLRMHVEAHGNFTTHRCHHCPMEFTLELEMLEHIEAKHVERSNIMICDLCGRAYKNRHFFLRHMSVHNVLKKKNRGEKMARRRKQKIKSNSLKI